MDDLDFSCCVICGKDERPLDDSRWCDDCLEMDRNTDWDAWDEKRRNRIAEENEY